MNVNDFVMPSNSKARSVKLNAKNLQDLRKVTATLAGRSREMEERLEQLKVSMSKEKEERGRSEWLKWTSGQCGSLTSNFPKTNLKENKESKLQKKCLECTENYCIGCFNKFHQKGALKLHRMVPIQRALQTYVNSQDIATCLQKPINPSLCPSTTGVPNSVASASSIAPRTITRRGVNTPGKDRKAENNHVKMHSDGSQVLIVDHGEKKQDKVIGIDEEKQASTLLRGEFNEEESARSFQEAVRQWRGERKDEGPELMTDADAGCLPARPASVSAVATQANPHTDKGAQGQRRGEERGRVAVKVEFTPNRLTYADRLLLKKHRRTPIHLHDTPVSMTARFEPPTTIKTEEENSALTAEEEDFRDYWASLFVAPVSRDKTQPKTVSLATPKSRVVTEVLHETHTDRTHACDTKQSTKINPEDVSTQKIIRREEPLVFQTSRSSLEAASPETVPELLSSKQDFVQALRSPKTLASQSKTSAFSTSGASETSKESIRTTTSKSLRSICSPTVHKSKANHGSPQFLSSLSHSLPDISKSSRSPIPFSADAFASANNKSAIPEEHLSHSLFISFSLRSSSTVSSLSTTESTLLPKVYRPLPLQEGSDSFLVEDIKPTSPLLAKPISTPKLCKSTRGSPMTQQQSQPSLRDQEPLLSDKPTQMPLSHVSTSKNGPWESSQSEVGPETRRTTANSSSRVSPLSGFSHGNWYTHQSSPPYHVTPVFMSPAPECDGHLSTPHRDGQDILIPSCQLQNVTDKDSLTVSMSKEQKETKEREDEISLDSRLTQNEEDSSDDEVLMRVYSVRSRTKEEHAHPFISQAEKSFVPSKSVSESEAEMDYRMDKPEQLLEPSAVMHEWGAGPGSQHFCDLNGPPPLGLDLNAADFDTPEHTHCDPFHTCQSALHDTDPTGSEVDPAPRKLSQAAQEIKEIYNVDQTGCEDPDLDADTTAHILNGLEQLLPEETNLVFRKGTGENSAQPGNHHVLWSKVSDDEEEEAVESDQRAVLLLP